VEILYKKILAIAPKNLRGLCGLSRVLFQKNKLDAAKQLLEKVFSIKPNYPYALSILGNIHRQLGEKAEAESLYKKSIELEPSLIFPRFNLGLIYFKDSKLEQAEAFFLESIRIDPEFIPSYHALGELYLYKCDYVLAKEYYQKAITLDSDNQRFLLGYAELLYTIKEFEAAYTLYEQVHQLIIKHECQLNELTWEYYFHKTQCARYLKKLDESFNLCLEALKLYPLDPMMHYEMAVAYNNQNDFERAALYCMKAIELKPEPDEWSQHLWLIDYAGNMPEKKDFWDEIITRLYNLLEINPKFVEIASIVSGIYSYSGQNDRALKAIQGFKTIFPNEVEVFRLEAVIYDLMGEKDKYREALKALLELDPMNSDAQRQLADLNIEPGNQ
jgi:tetratricopeptide (TPR) repeat protein